MTSQHRERQSDGRGPERHAWRGQPGSLGMRSSYRWPGLVLFAGALVCWSLPVHADEPLKGEEPDVLREPAEITTVIDAFDGPDPFDANYTIGLQWTSKTAAITRETHSTEEEFSSGGYTAGNMNVATYEEATTRLNQRLDIGIYRDLALIFRLPLILSNDRRLSPVDGSETQQNTILQGLPGERLFTIPFDSPSRSGIEYLAIGIDTNVLSQWRDPTKPTWRLGIEGRFDVSEPLHACAENPSPGQVKCAHPSDINRNGSPDGEYEGSSFSGGRSPGVSRGTTGFEFHTFMSKRIRYMEPYAGIEGLFEFQNENSEFGNVDLQGALVNHPPFQGTLTLGTAITPWERLERFQRLEFDLRFGGTYRSEGRDYSELFDALGSSPAASLREPRFSEYQANGDADTLEESPSVVNESSRMVYTTGITDVQQHGIYTFTTQATFHAMRYLKFNVGTALTFVQGHLLTFDQPCNPNFKDQPEKSGPCRSGGGSAGNIRVTGIPNANYREVLNTPGRRFRVDSSTTWDLWINATAMF
jgi:hypothetical protein